MFTALATLHIDLPILKYYTHSVSFVHLKSIRPLRSAQKPRAKLHLFYASYIMNELLYACTSKAIFFMKTCTRTSSMAYDEKPTISALLHILNEA